MRDKELEVCVEIKGFVESKLGLLTQRKEWECM